MRCEEIFVEATQLVEHALRDHTGGAADAEYLAGLSRHLDTRAMVALERTAPSKQPVTRAVDHPWIVHVDNAG